MIKPRTNTGLTINNLLVSSVKIARLFIEMLDEIKAAFTSIATTLYLSTKRAYDY